MYTEWDLMAYVSLYQSPNQQQESSRGQAREILRKMGLRVIPKQVWMTKQLFFSVCVYLPSCSIQRLCFSLRSYIYLVVTYRK